MQLSVIGVKLMGAYWFETACISSSWSYYYYDDDDDHWHGLGGLARKYRLAPSRTVKHTGQESGGELCGTVKF